MYLCFHKTDDMAVISVLQNPWSGISREVYDFFFFFFSFADTVSKKHMEEVIERKHCLEPDLFGAGV